MRCVSSRVRDLLGAELDRELAQVRRQVVVIALEAMAGDADLRREGVELVEAVVGHEMAPVPERQPDVRVLAQFVDQDRHVHS